MERVYQTNCGASGVAMPKRSTVEPFRVQISIRGQRYEMAMETAIATSILFKLFFTSPFDFNTAMAIHNTEQGKQVVEEQAPDPQTLLEFLASEGDRPFDWWEKKDTHWLLEEYYKKHIALKVKQELNDFCSQERTAVHPAFVEVWDTLWASMDHQNESFLCRSETRHFNTISTSPWMVPYSISVDREASKWIFIFPSLVTFKEAQVLVADLSEASTWWIWWIEWRRQLSLRNTPASAALLKMILPETKDMSAQEKDSGVQLEEIHRELNNDPMVLLQPEFWGLLMVFLRRITAAVAQSQPVPVLALRWRELTPIQKIGIQTLIQILGIIPLAPLCFASGSTQQHLKNDAILIKSEDKSHSLFLNVEGDPLPFPGACHHCGTVGHLISTCPFTLPTT